MNEGQFKAFIELLKEIRDISKEIEKQQAELLSLFKGGNKTKDEIEIKFTPTITANFVDEKGNVVKLPTRKGQPPTPPTMQEPKRRIRRS